MSKKWRPGVGDDYYYLVINFSHWIICRNHRLGTNDKDYDFNVYKTEAEAELALKKIKAILKSGEIK